MRWSFHRYHHPYIGDCVKRSNSRLTSYIGISIDCMRCSAITCPVKLLANIVDDREGIRLGELRQLRTPQQSAPFPRPSYCRIPYWRHSKFKFSDFGMPDLHWWRTSETWPNGSVDPSTSILPREVCGRLTPTRPYLTLDQLLNQEEGV